MGTRATVIEATTLAGLSGLRHGFFTRRGGVSEGVHASLNCGLGSQDDRARVAENRARVARVLDADGRPVLTAHQVHSADAVVVDRPWGEAGPARADALVTATPGIVVGALAADCAPVLLADPDARVVAAAHAGWKGALNGILEATVATMERIGARRDRIHAVLGPCIGPESYEVGPEFEARFIASARVNARFFRRWSPDARPTFDLPAFIMHRLAQLELASIASVTRCTYANEADHFSYRRATHRQEADYGRQISAIVLT